MLKITFICGKHASDGGGGGVMSQQLGSMYPTYITYYLNPKHVSHINVHGICSVCDLLCDM